MKSEEQIFARALEAERLRNGRQIARFRVVAAGAMLVLNLGFEWFRPGYQGPAAVPLTIYTALAAFFFWWWRADAAAARWSGRAIPLIDMPFIYVILRRLVADLSAGGYPDDATATATNAALFFLMMIIAASLSLDELFTWITAGVALVLQSLLLRGDGRDWTFISIVAVITVLGTWLSLYARRRSLALVRVAAREQTRRERLGRYFSPQVAAALVEREDEIGRGETREVTVLFADLRDFTAMAERLDGRAVVALLNDFHVRMVDQIFAHGGTLDKYLGDGLMAYFGAPVPRADHAEQAVLCALDMHAALARMNRERSEAGLAPLRLGIGVHTGAVILGDIGTEHRREYTAIGDTVNVAARLEQLTKATGAATLASGATRRLVTMPLAFTALEPIAVKGKAEPLEVYRVDPLAEASSKRTVSS